MRALLIVGWLGILVVGIVVCIVLFIAGLFRPGRSRRMQGGVDRASIKGEEKSSQTAGPFGDATASTLRIGRKAADKSAEKGRETHGKLTSDEQA
ncbi:MAG TPA: hypothetical protein VF660_08535 [Actinomycetota bacterium]